MITTADRVLSILQLFSAARPSWSVEEAAAELGMKTSTAYRYFRSLASAGLIVSHRQGSYVVGPAVIELDRQTRLSDPLIKAARPDLERLQAEAGRQAGALLCRLYGLRVICVDQCMPEAGPASSYERGRPMPLFRGSASKAMLAYLPWRTLRRLHDEHRDAMVGAGLGTDWESFLRQLRDIRRHGVNLTAGEVDPGLAGISSPIFSVEGEVIASIGVVLQASRVTNPERLRLEALVRNAGEETTRRLATLS